MNIRFIDGDEWQIAEVIEHTVSYIVIKDYGEEEILIPKSAIKWIKGWEYEQEERIIDKISNDDELDIIMDEKKKRNRR